ncbi:hypothetical protein F1721_32880 [Saccharopolyspora hirsuta]|uniref:Uncharacterized protein n=1 Tax=Saccharopolyspora hirsuta TaxID=1837 RepID=A0A5M7BD51_SACHI|nr:hypothetical protein [Saccharopolyspora hirsuta]KAA5825434.1 hypothetical protein F1721_32880 [Saccharopolyspora hirsuta]
MITTKPAENFADEIRRFTEEGILFTVTMANATGAQQTRYGIATRADNTLIGSYYPCNIDRQEHWCVATADGYIYKTANEPNAVIKLITLA